VHVWLAVHGSPLSSCKVFPELFAFLTAPTYATSKLPVGTRTSPEYQRDTGRFARLPLNRFCPHCRHLTEQRQTDSHLTPARRRRLGGHHQLLPRGAPPRGRWRRDGGGLDHRRGRLQRPCHKPPPVTASNRHLTPRTNLALNREPSLRNFIFSPISEFFVIVNGNEKLVLLGESRSLILGIGLG
jgi:hypothetical protein